MERKQSLGRVFLGLSAISAYGIWIMIFIFPLVLAGTITLIDERRSPDSLILSSIALGIISASYILRFYLVRNTKSLRTKVLRAGNREQTLLIIIGGVWWWLITLICSITAVIYSRSLFWICLPAHAVKTGLRPVRWCDVLVFLRQQIVDPDIVHRVRQNPIRGRHSP